MKKIESSQILSGSWYCGWMIVIKVTSYSVLGVMGSDSSVWFILGSIPLLRFTMGSIVWVLGCKKKEQVSLLLVVKITCHVASVEPLLCHSRVDTVVTCDGYYFSPLTILSARALAKSSREINPPVASEAFCSANWWSSLATVFPSLVFPK